MKTPKKACPEEQRKKIVTLCAKGKMQTHTLSQGHHSPQMLQAAAAAEFGTHHHLFSVAGIAEELIMVYGKPARDTTTTTTLYTKRK
jgi:hypothetical protein